MISTRLSGAPCAQPMDTHAPSVPHAHLTPSQALRRDLLAVRWALLFQIVIVHLVAVAFAWLAVLLPVHPLAIIAWPLTCVPIVALGSVLFEMPLSYLFLSLCEDVLAEEAGGSSADANL